MEANIPYIIRVALALAVFYIVYFALFRDGKNFLFKRIYFISAVLMSITIPMISFQVEAIAQNEEMVFAPLPSYIQFLTPEVQSINNPAQQAESALHTFGFDISQSGWLGVIWMIFALGVGVLLLRTVVGHFKIRKVVKNASSRVLYGSLIWVTTENFPPFTYFRKVVIPASILESPYLKVVISHEQIHTKGLHCLDLYMADILCIIQWFNPFAWFLKRAIRDNIEFLTDDLVTRQIDPDEYQLGMVSLAGKDMISAFPAISNMSQLKKRIEMMKKVESIRYQWVRILLLVPILALLTITLSGREICVVEMSEAEFVETNPAIATQGQVGTTTTSRADVVFEIADSSDVYFVFDGRLYAPGTLDLNAIKYNIESIEVLDAEAAKGQYGVAPVYIIEKGENAEGPIIFKFNPPTILSTQSLVEATTAVGLKISGEIKSFDGPDYIVKGRGVKRITVLKDALQYGEEVVVEDKEKPGEEIVELALIDGDNTIYLSSVRVRFAVPENVIYMVNGKRSASLHNLEIDIESFTRLTKEKAIELYGESGENGVVEVKTR